MKNKLRLIITAITLLSFPSINFGQVPNLRTTSGFALFTANGAFTNTGPTNVTGNIGTNAGALTGFPPGILVGTSHVADSVSAQAAIDVDTLYNYIFALTCDTSIGVILGSGQSLKHKVYCVSAASSLIGNLTLNGEGDSTTLFIFKLSGALTTATHTNIVLINSALQKNVYWCITGAFSLGDSSVFRGNVVATGAITLLQGAALYGRGLSTSGGIYLHTNINSLPVELLSFNANCNNQIVTINWSTASEINNDFYTIERGTDGINWQVAGKVECSGNSSELRNYSFSDKSTNNDVSYYRLKQTDLDGNFKYYNTVAVNNCKQNINQLTIYPNPFNTSITVFINNDSPIKNTELRMYNILGTEVMNKIITDQSTTFETNDLPLGMYFYKINANNKTIQSGKLISQ